MNDISWLGQTNAPEQRPVERQKTGDGESEKGSKASFAAFLTGDGVEPSRAQAQAQLASQTPKTLANIPATAVDPTSVHARDALSTQSRGVSVFFASTQNGPVSFRAVAQVNGEAIAFNARAIVGPASFAHTPDDVFSSLENLNAKTFAGAREAFIASMGVEAEAIGLALNSPSIGYRSSDRPSGVLMRSTVPAPGGTIAPALGRGVQSASNSAAVQSVVGTTTSVVSDTSAQTAPRASHSAPALPVQMASTQSPAFAHILATPSEYRLVIRSLRLSEDMRDLVMRTVRSGLAEFGLSQMPLSVFEQNGAD